MKTAKERWETERSERFKEASSRHPDGWIQTYDRERIEEDMWRNVSIEDPMYAMKIHFKPNNEPNPAPPIIEAAMNGHSEIVRLLLNHGADAEILTLKFWGMESERSGNVSLAVAARQGSIKIHLNPPSQRRSHGCGESVT